MANKPVVYDDVTKRHKPVTTLEQDMVPNTVVGDGLAGTGKTGNPLKLNIDENVLMFKDGKLTLVPEDCVDMGQGNLDTLESNKEQKATLKRRGVTCFQGVINVVEQKLTIGSPKDFITAGSLTSEAMSSTTEFTGPKSASFDYNGYQVASSSEITQYVSANKNQGDGEGFVWMRTNDSGMDDNGNVRQPDQWSKWHRVDDMPQIGGSGGLDCEAIASLPNHPGFSEGDVVLVRTASGECRTVKVRRSLIVDLKASAGARDTSIYNGENTEVTLQVTNAGSEVADIVNVTLTVPDSQLMTATDFISQTYGTATIEKKSNTKYVIKNMGTGATVKFKTTANTVKGQYGGGSFAIDVDAIGSKQIDWSLDDNHASVQVTVNKRNQAADAQPVDCPLIEVTCDGKQLPVTTAGYNKFITSSLYDHSTDRLISAVIDTAKTTIIRLKNAPVVSVASTGGKYPTGITHDTLKNHVSEYGSQQGEYVNTTDARLRVNDVPVAVGDGYGTVTPPVYINVSHKTLFRFGVDSDDVLVESYSTKQVNLRRGAHGVVSIAVNPPGTNCKIQWLNVIIVDSDITVQNYVKPQLLHTPSASAISLSGESGENAPGGTPYVLDKNIVLIGDNFDSNYEAFIKDTATVTVKKGSAFTGTVKTTRTLVKGTSYATGNIKVDAVDDHTFQIKIAKTATPSDNHQIMLEGSKIIINIID